MMTTQNGDRRHGRDIHTKCITAEKQLFPGMTSRDKLAVPEWRGEGVCPVQTYAHTCACVERAVPGAVRGGGGLGPADTYNMHMHVL